MAVKTYALSEVSITLNNQILSGYAPDTAISIDWPNAMWSRKVSGDATLVSRSKSGDSAPTITFTLMQTAESNQTLTDLYNDDVQNNDGVYGVEVKDGLGKSLYSGEGWLTKHPKADFGIEEKTREWTIDCGLMPGAITGGN